MLFFVVAFASSHNWLRASARAKVSSPLGSLGARLAALRASFRASLVSCDSIGNIVSSNQAITLMVVSLGSPCRTVRNKARASGSFRSNQRTSARLKSELAQSPLLGPKTQHQHKKHSHCICS